MGKQNKVKSADENISEAITQSSILESEEYQNQDGVVLNVRAGKTSYRSDIDLRLINVNRIFNDSKDATNQANDSAFNSQYRLFLNNVISMNTNSDEVLEVSTIDGNNLQQVIAQDDNFPRVVELGNKTTIGARADLVETLYDLNLSGGAYTGEHKFVQDIKTYNNGKPTEIEYSKLESQYIIQDDTANPSNFFTTHLGKVVRKKDSEFKSSGYLKASNYSQPISTLNKGYEMDYDSIRLFKDLSNIVKEVKNKWITKDAPIYRDLVNNPNIISSIVYDASQIGTLLRILLDSIQGAMNSVKEIYGKTGIIPYGIQVLGNLTVAKRLKFFSNMSVFANLASELPYNKDIISRWNKYKNMGYVKGDKGYNDPLIIPYFRLLIRPLEKSFIDVLTLGELGYPALKWNYSTCLDLLTSLKSSIPIMKMKDSSGFIGGDTPITISYNEFTPLTTSLFLDFNTMDENAESMVKWFNNNSVILRYIKELDVLNGEVFSFSKVSLPNYDFKFDKQISAGLFKGIDNLSFKDIKIAISTLPIIPSDSLYSPITIKTSKYVELKSIRALDSEKKLILAFSSILPAFNSGTEMTTGSFVTAKLKNYLAKAEDIVFYPFNAYSYGYGVDKSDYMGFNTRSIDSIVLPVLKDSPVNLINKGSFLDSFTFKEYGKFLLLNTPIEVLFNDEAIDVINIIKCNRSFSYLQDINYKFIESPHSMLRDIEYSYLF